MMNQNIVITMAGRGSRFYEAGYTVPKYEIMAHGYNLFHWSMLSLKNFLTTDSRLIFVCLEENHSDDFVRAQCRSMGLKDVHIFELAQVTDGQATSAYVSRELWLPDSPLLIYNIDTYVNPSALHPSQIRSGSDGWVPCFRVPGDHWSFVKVDENEWATDITEKNRISDYASIGLYWFARASEFVMAYEEFFSNPVNLVRGERYVAPLYKYLVCNKKKISISDLPVSDVHVLGTPTELNEFLNEDMKQPSAFS
jgi:dTDP-glucose pyrophosphorylase